MSMARRPALHHRSAMWRAVSHHRGLSGVAEAVQTAWVKMVAAMWLLPSGQVMAAAALLTENKKPTDADIDAAMSGNLCRCNTYHRIRGAVHEAAKMLEA
jgi:isoquinoline 1-oxidoreductase alpha subunit